MSYLKLLKHLPEGPTAVAFSGGPDSTAVLDFLLNTRRVLVLMFDHGTGRQEQGLRVLENLIQSRKLNNKHVNYSLEIDKIEDPKIPKGASDEEYWRNARYSFFDKFSSYNIITGHTLDDNVETWLWSCATGNPRLIPYRRNNVYRPFMLNTKQDMYAYCLKNSVPWFDDPTNLDFSNMRGIMRTKVIPEMLRINPGLFTTVKNLILSQNS